MNLSEKLVTVFILIAVGFFGFNIAHSKLNKKTTVDASINGSQINSIN